MQPDIIEEYITSDEWSLKCKVLGCNWSEWGERTENWMEEIQEIWTEHEKLHESRT